METRSSTVKLVLEDGREYDLQVRLEAVEQPGLTQRAGQLFGAVAAFLKWAFALAAAAVVGALAAGVIGSEIADEYADLQRERELDATMLTTISRGAAELYGEARQLSTSAAPDTRKSERLRSLLAAWIGTSAEVDALLDVYHPAETASARQARRHWRRYQGALYQYARLACCAGRDERKHGVTRISSYLRTHGAQVDQIFFRVSREPLNRSAALKTLGRGDRRPHYNALGLYLLQGSAPLGADLQASKPSLD